MAVHVREKPPLRLDHDIETPSGRHYHWSGQEPDPANMPSGVRNSSTMPGGWESGDCVLSRKPGVEYQDLERLSTWRLLGPGGEVAGEYRLERAPRVSGERMAVSPSAVGWQAHLEDDKSAAEIYVDRDLSGWTTAPSRTRALALLTASPNVVLDGETSVAPDAAGLPSVTLRQTRVDSVAGSRNRLAETWYDAAGVPIGLVYYDVATSQQGGASMGGTGWVVRMQLSSTDNTAATDTSADLDGGGVGFLSATGVRPFALLQLFYEPTITADGSWQADWRNLAVYGGHGLTRRGPDPGGFYSSDVEAHAVGRWAPLLNFTEGADGTISPSTFAIPQLAFKDRTAAAEIVRQATRFELRDWAVWEDKTYWAHERGARGRSWRARTAPAQLEETGPQVDRLWESILVQYADVGGQTRTVGPPGSGADTESALLQDSDPESPAAQIGIVRRDLLTMGTATAASATEVGRRFLEQTKALDNSGRAKLVGHVEDDRGVLHPYWMVRAGDQISFVDAADQSYRRIVKADHTHAERTCSVDLDAPPEGLQALLERLGVVLVPLGVG